MYVIPLTSVRLFFLSFHPLKCAQSKNHMAASYTIEFVNPESYTRLECELTYTPQLTILESLPPEIHFRVLSHLSPNDRIILSLTCKRNYALHFSSLPNENCNHGKGAHFKTLIGNLVAPQNAEMVMSNQGYTPFIGCDEENRMEKQMLEIEKPLWPRIKEWMSPKWIWGCEEEPEFLMGRKHFVFVSEAVLEQKRDERNKKGLTSWKEHKRSLEVGNTNVFGTENDG